MSTDMIRKTHLFVLMLLFSTGSFADHSARPNPITPHLERLAPVEYSVPPNMSENERKMYANLILAAQVIDDIFIEQFHPYNLQWLSALKNMSQQKDPVALSMLEYFGVSYGPWNIFQPEEWILPEGFFGKKAPDATPMLAGYNVYPFEIKNGSIQSIDKKELDEWVKKHPKDEKAFKSPFTVIERTGKGLVATPYSVKYKGKLEKAAKYLETAAELSSEPLVQTHLRSRAKAFRTNQFYDTDVDWVATHGSNLQVLIGPYEEIDEIWGVKRGFMAQIGFRDQPYSQALERYKALGDTFQKNLPIDPKYAPDRLKEPFFTVYRQVYSSGLSRQGVQVLAEKLTNDREFTIQHGARQMFFRNTQDGKCENTLLPISKVVLPKADHRFVTCDAFFKATLHHEYAHALGVSFWYPDWEKPDATQRKEINDNLPQWGGKLEELKADTLGFYNQLYMLEQGLEKEKGRDLLHEMYASMIAGFFRSVRFGLHKSYALNAMIMLNHMLDAKAVSFDPKTGLVRWNGKKMPQVIRQNAADALMLQVQGNDEAVKEYFEKWAVIRPETQNLIDRIAKANIPQDLHPKYPILESLKNLL